VSSTDLEGTTVTRLCSQCGSHYRGELSPCPHDGAVVEDGSAELARDGAQEEAPPREAAPPREDALVGTTLAEHYQILSLIGTGGMSAVYKARHLLMDKIVAIKVLLAHLVSHANTLRRFQQEAKAVSHLSHPNIIAVHDFGISPQGQPYLIMDYLEGHSLSDLLEKVKCLPPERAYPIFFQICDALGHSHQRGTVHRDLKPSNIMLVKSGHTEDFVKIVDFGIAKLMPGHEAEGQHLTKTGEIFGSPLYMSPEHCMGQNIDARSDIYSMGCVMYEALVGRAPFHGNNVLETMYMRLSETAPSFSQVRPDLKISPDLEAVIFTAMAIEPEQRYQTMEELKAQLELTLPENQGRGGLKITVPKAPGKYRKLLAKKGIPIELVYALCFVIVLVGGVVAWRQVNAPAQEPSSFREELAWQQLERDGQRQWDQGNHAEAERLFTQAVQQAEKFGESDKRLTSSLMKLAGLYQDQGKEKQAQEVAQRIESIQAQHPAQQLGDAETNLNELVDVTLGLVPKVLRKEEWAEYHKLTEKLSHLAVLCEERNDYDKAEELFKKELDIERQTLGQDSPDVARTLSNLAALYHKYAGRFEEAEKLYQQALFIREKEFGKNNPEVAGSLLSLALLCENEGKYALSQELYNRALGIYKTKYGMEHADVATTLAGMAELYRVQGKFDQAEPLYKQALEINERLENPDHPSVTSSRHNLAGLYAEEGKYAKAEPLYRQTLASYEKTDGPESPHVAVILNNLGSVLIQEGKYRDAEVLLKRALAIRARVLMPDHPELAQSLNALGEAYRLQDKFGDAEPLLKQALEIDEQSLGPDNPETALVLNGLGNLYAGIGKYDQAEEFYERALKIRGEVLGLDHPSTARTLNDLANLYVKLGRFGEAEALYKQALDIRERTQGKEHPDTASTLDGYADLLLKTNRLREGLDLKGRALAIRLKPFWTFN